MNLPIANLMFAPENWLVLGLLGLLLFGKRLPEVGRNLGKGIIQFKKGLAGIDDDVTLAGQHPMIGRNEPAILPWQPAAVHKFDPYTGKPAQQREGANSDD
jgi:sec-independent protein translocase protein TatA